MGVYLPLPSEYQEVEYIQSSGTQYINTGYIPTIYDSIEVKFKTKTSSSDTILYGSRRRDASTNTYEDFSVRINTSSGKGIAVHYPKDGTTAGGYTDTSWFYTGNIISNPHTLKVTPNYCYVDGALVYTFNVTRTAYNGTYPSRIFGMNSNLSGDFKGGKFTVYYLKIWNNNTLVRDFVPCYRKSDNVIGMYDLVNNQFYTNSGTGTFTKGADVTAVPLKNAYIGGYYEYSYDFRNKTTAQFTADGWTAYEGTPSFNADGIYGSSGNLRNKITLPLNLTNAKKITIIENYKWTGSSAGTRSGLAVVSDMTHWNGVYLQGTARGIDLDSTFTQITNSASSSTGTFTETLVLDLINKTYTTSGHWSYTKTLTDAQIASIKSVTGLYVMLYNSNYIRVSDISLTVEN